MPLTKIIGIAMIAALFIGLFVLCVVAVGLPVALLIGWIVAGVYLINPV